MKIKINLPRNVLYTKDNFWSKHDNGSFNFANWFSMKLNPQYDRVFTVVDMFSMVIYTYCCTRSFKCPWAFRSKPHKTGGGLIIKLLKC